MSSKHTRGPWTLTESETTTYVGTPNCGVAKIMEVGDERTEGNARLIAAAPECYEQLKLIQAYLKEKGITWTGIDAAIAKAEGRE